MRKLILFADDHPLFRQALRETIAPIFADADIRELDSLEQTKAVLAQEPVEMLLLDLRMPDSNGLAGLMLIKGSYPALPVIIVSASEEAETVRAAIQAGASGYIYKSYSFKQIHDAVTRVAAGEIVVPDDVDADVSEDEHQELDTISRLSGLTPTQLRVFILLSQGHMNKQIAADMQITEATVKAHITSIYKTLDVRTRAQAVMIAKALDVLNSEISLDS